jgi:hypothetical protein
LVGAAVRIHGAISALGAEMLNPINVEADQHNSHTGKFTRSQVKG